MSSRRPPLHTCALSFFKIAEKTSLKAQELNGPIVNNCATFLSPIFSTLQYIILATLLFLDIYILACEDKIVSLSPSSNHVFNKIDELVRSTETLPGKFDSLLDRAIAHVTKCDHTKKTDQVIDNHRESAAEPTTLLGNENGNENQNQNENEEVDGKELSYQSDSTVQTVSTEVSDREDAMDGLKEITEKGESEKGENKNGKQGLAEEWFEAGWGIKPKQAPKRKQSKSRKKKN